MSFVVPVKNDAVRLARCLARIASNVNDSKTCEIVVADNGSTDASPAVAAEAGARVLVLPGIRVSELRNQAVEAARGDLVAFVDADNEVADGWLDAARDVFRDPTVGAAGALYTSPERSWVQRMYGVLRGRTSGSRDVSWLSSGNLIVRREAFTAVRGFDPSLEACEDVDFCQRLTAAGWRLVGDERLRSVHLGDPFTLAALFRAERWRGRDNIRVTFRGRVSARDLPSVVIPVVQAACLVLTAAALLAVPALGAPAVFGVLLAVGAVVGLSGLRAARMIVAGGLRGLRPVGQAFVVALTYDLARATALLGRAPHHRRGATSATATA